MYSSTLIRANKEVTQLRLDIKGYIGIDVESRELIALVFSYHYLNDDFFYLDGKIIIHIDNKKIRSKTLGIMILRFQCRLQLAMKKKKKNLITSQTSRTNHNAAIWNDIQRKSHEVERALSHARFKTRTL